jgi:hypothetical protein
METPAMKARIFACHKEATCSKMYTSKKVLRRHEKRKHQQHPSTPFSATLRNASTTHPTAVRDASTTHPTVVRDASYNETSRISPPRDIIDYEPVQLQQFKEEYVTVDEYSTNPDEELREESHYRNIITNFFAYWTNARAEAQMIDTNALMLIHHLRCCKERDILYLATVMASFDVLAQDDLLRPQTLCDITRMFVKNVRREKQDGLFDWNCLVIFFTTTHNLLMKFPHLYPDLVEILCELFHLVGADLKKLGGWNDFMEYYRWGVCWKMRDYHLVRQKLVFLNHNGPKFQYPKGFC